MCFIACSALFLQIFCRKSLGWLWLCSLAEDISTLCFKSLKMNVESGNKYKWKTPCSLRETRCFQAYLGICTNNLSIRPRLLHYYMVGHSQDRTLCNRTMSIFESSDLLRSTMGTTRPMPHRTLQNLFSILIQYFFFKGTLYEHCRAFSGPMLL